MLTDKRLAYMTHNDIFGGWQVSVNTIFVYSMCKFKTFYS